MGGRKATNICKMNVCGYKRCEYAECLWLCACTVVWTIMARWSRSVLTMSSGNTGRVASRRVSAVSIVIRTPVLPIPALKGGRERERERWRWKTPLCSIYSGRRWCSTTPTTFDVKCVHYLQCTISGSSPLLLSLMEVVNSRKSEGSSGTPWSGHATYCRCVTARSSPL